MYKKEIRNCKRLIIFCLFAVAFSGVNLVWGFASERIFSIISGLFCAVMCSFCVMRSIKTIESYADMSKQVECMIEREKCYTNILNNLQESKVQDPYSLGWCNVTTETEVKDGLDQMH